MRPLHSLVLAIVLAGLACSWAQAGEDAPRLPCGAAPLPAYAEPGMPPAVQLWSGKAAQTWLPPACAGWTTAGYDMLVAVSGSFRHAGEFDELLARVGAISAKKGVRYWSTTDKAWQPLVIEAFALSGPDLAQKRGDFTAAQITKGQSLYYAQSDNRSSGKTIYRERILAADRDRLVMSSENVTAVKMVIVTLFDVGDLQAVVFLERRSPGVWNYYSMTRTRMASSMLPTGGDASYINRAVASFRYVAGIPTDQEPPAAR
jgi:hypothetical protein